MTFLVTEGPPVSETDPALSPEQAVLHTGARWAMDALVHPFQEACFGLLWRGMGGSGYFLRLANSSEDSPKSPVLECANAFSTHLVKVQGASDRLNSSTR